MPQDKDITATLADLLSGELQNVRVYLTHPDEDHFESFANITERLAGLPLTEIYLPDDTNPGRIPELVSKELAEVRGRLTAEAQKNNEAIVTHLARDQTKPELVVSSVIIPAKKVAEGVLVRSTSLVWASIAQELKNDWRKAFSIDWRVWEEILAGAYSRAGYEVILTPRSGDHGRDVIASKDRVGSVRILGSMKAYKPGHLVTKEEVHALMGVLAIDHNASKGMLTTTSDFAPRLRDDPGLKASIPYRIELMNGKQLQTWLTELLGKETNEP